MVTQLGRFAVKETKTEVGSFCVVFVPDRENSVPLVVVYGLTESNATELADKLNGNVMDFRFDS